MITPLLFFVFALATPGGGEADQSTPEGTLQMVFDAAASGDYSKLPGLCYEEEGDGDVQYICTAKEDEPSFSLYFKNGKIKDAARIDPSGDRAEVDFYFGLEGKDEETMRLFKIGEKWYLGSF